MSQNESNANVRINLAEGMRKGAAEIDFWVQRAKAIQTYANLEQGLCEVFSYVGEIPLEAAGIVFFKISSAQARNSILDKLQRRKFQGRYNLFWNSFIEALRPIDIKRNEIVHWNTINNIVFDPVTTETNAEFHLKPPTYWFGFDPNAPAVKKDNLIAFGLQCGFYATLAKTFALAMQPNRWLGPENERLAWLDIFSQPVIYPPPEGHPLFPRHTTPGTLPSASPG
jgi:hypothetical protein